MCVCVCVSVCVCVCVCVTAFANVLVVCVSLVCVLFQLGQSHHRGSMFIWAGVWPYGTKQFEMRIHTHTHTLKKHHKGALALHSMQQCAH